MKTTKSLFGILTITVALAVQVQAQSFLTNGLVAYYPFNGNAEDASGSNNNGIVSGAILTFDRANTANNAYSFDGAGAHINLPSLYSFSATNLTLSAWIKLNTLGSRKVIIGKLTGLDTIGNVYLEINDNIIRTSFCNVASASGWILTAGTTPLVTGVWYHIMATDDGSNQKVFLNGVEDGSTQYSQGIGINSIPWMIGAHPNTSGNVIPGFDFDGTIDDIRIYNRALSSTEVAQLYAIESASIIKPAVILNVRSAVYLDSSNLLAGSSYQVQASSDLINWTNQGSVFTATNSIWRSTNYWDVANWN